MEDIKVRLTAEIKDNLKYPYIFYIRFPDLCDFSVDDPINCYILKDWVIKNIGGSRKKVMFWGIERRSGEYRFKSRSDAILFGAFVSQDPEELADVKDWLNDFVKDSENITDEELAFFKLTWG